MNILFVQNKNIINGAGGTEKVCVTLANYFASLGHNVCIATNDAVRGLPFYKLNSTVEFINIHPFGEKHIRTIKKYRGRNILKLILYRITKATLAVKGFLTFGYRYKKQIQQLKKIEQAQRWKLFIEHHEPDIVITMSIGSLLEMAYQQSYRIPIINSVNMRPDHEYTDILWPRSKNAMRELQEAYSHLSGVQILFESYRQFLPETFTGRVYVIPNAVIQTDPSAIICHTKAKERFFIITLSRLHCECKQQDFAIKVFSLLTAKHPDWDMLLWGDGPDKGQLEALIKKLKLEDRVFLKGQTENPREELKKADIFVFPSKYEGFGLALAEAMSVGLPVVGLTTCSGVNELIKDEENGFLVNNAEEFVNRLDELMGDADLRNRLGQKAHEDMKRFSPENVFKQWQEALHDQISTRTSLIR